MTQPSPFRPEISERLAGLDLDDLMWALEGRLSRLDVSRLSNLDPRAFTGRECTITCYSCLYTDCCTRGCPDDLW